MNKIIKVLYKEDNKTYHVMGQQINGTKGDYLMLDMGKGKAPKKIKLSDSQWLTIETNYLKELMKEQKTKHARGNKPIKIVEGAKGEVVKEVTTSIGKRRNKINIEEAANIDKEELINAIKKTKTK